MGSPQDAPPLPLGEEGNRASVVCFPLSGFSFPSPSPWWCLLCLPETAGFQNEISRYSVGVHGDHKNFLQFFQNFSDYFLVPASKSFILTKYLQYWLSGSKLGGSATFYLQFLHEDTVSLITWSANFSAANKAEVRFALAKHNYFR